MKSLKLFLILVLMGAVAVFSIQNAAVLEVNFLVWSFEIRRVFLIFGVLAVGMIAGWVMRAIAHRDRHFH